MELTDTGSIVLSKQDMDGVRSLILAKKRMAVDIHTPTETNIRDLVLSWEKLTGDKF